MPARHYRPFVNFYAMGPASVFAIFREGDEVDEEALKALIRAAVAFNKSSARG